MEHPNLRDRLRSLPVFGESLPEFNTEGAPFDPAVLFIEWLELAIADGVAQPHAMTLATGNRSGEPSARTLLLKDVTADGFWFATMSSSPKGRDLEANYSAALVFYWREHGRQVRVAGAVGRGPRDVSDADFLQRHPHARATAIAGKQSEPLPSDAEREAGIAAALVLVETDPSLVAPNWSSYILDPEIIEFWQARPDREQLRLRYSRLEGTWVRELLWP